MTLKEHPLAIAALSIAGTITLATTVFFSAVIPTWRESKENEISRLKIQIQDLQTAPSTLRTQVENLKREATNATTAATAALNESAKRIKSLEEQIEAERSAKASAEARATRDRKLREEAEEKNRKAEENQKNVSPRRKDEISNTSTAVESSDSRAQETETSSPPQSSAKPQTFDLGDIVAIADWARSDGDNLEVSFSFLNKTKHPLWIIPATRRDKGGIQASDNRKNSYQLRGTIGFKRGTIELRVSKSLNEFLALQPNVPSMARLRFWQNRGGVAGATEVRIFATLTVVKDLETLDASDRTISATLPLK